jgi:signal transduction histidine kinase
MKLSIRVSLTMWYCVAFCSGALLLGIGACVGLNSAIMRAVDKDLSARIDGVDDYLTQHLGRLPLQRVQQELSTHGALRPAYVSVQNDQGVVIYCGAAIKQLCAAGNTVVSLPSTIGANIRVLSAVHTIKGAPYAIIVASDLSFQHEILRQFYLLLFFTAPVALVCATLGGYWLSGRALAPVREIIHSVHSIGEKSLSLRLQVPPTGDEIQQLSETLNGMLTRVENAFRKVTELTSNASHELRTPVAIIRTAAEVALLNTRPGIETHRKALQQICAEAEKSTKLLDSMLKLARADSGTQPLNLGRLSLVQSVKEAVNTCRRLAEGKGIVLVFKDDDPEELQVWADGHQLSRLWLLLLDNAVKYTSPGGEIIVGVSRDLNSSPICEIKDTGIGISQTDIPHVFQRFFRAENARVVADTGSGLGLAIARWIVEVHRAKIEVESSLGTGSTFRVVFESKTQVPVIGTAAQRAELLTMS